MADELDLTEVWARALASLGDEGMTSQQRAFVALTRPLAIIEDTALVAAPNEFTKDVLESRLRPLVVDALSRTLGREVRIAVTVDPAIAPALDEDATDDLADSTYADPVSAPPAPAPVMSPRSPASSRARVEPAGHRLARHPRRGDQPAQPQVHVRHLRHRLQQPVRPCRGGRRRGAAGQGLQPAVRLRRVRAGQDPPAARDRPLHPHPLRRCQRPLRELGGVHERVHQLDP